MSGWVTAAVLAGSVLTAATSAFSAHKTAKATKYAAKKQSEASEKALEQQLSETRQANQQTADMESILEQNTNSSELSSTLLTGSMGIDKDKLSLGKGTNLLGG